MSARVPTGLRHALTLIALAAVPALGQQRTVQQTAFGMTQPELIGLLEVPAVTGQKVKGATITGATTARVRTNVPWTLRVSLVPPVNPALTASFRLGNAKAVALSAANPTVVVTSGTAACAACSVTLAWDFTYKASGKTKVTPSVPTLLFEAAPTPRP